MPWSVRWSDRREYFRKRARPFPEMGYIVSMTANETTPKESPSGARSFPENKMSNLTFTKLAELVTYLTDSRTASVAKLAEKMSPAANAGTSSEDIYHAIECFRWNASEAIKVRYELAYLQEMSSCLFTNEESSEDLRWSNAKLIWESWNRKLNQMARSATSCSTSPDANLAENAHLAAIGTLTEDFTGLAKFFA